MSAERFRTMVSFVLAIGVSAAGVLIAGGLVLAIFVGWQGSILATTPASDPTDFGNLPARLGALQPVAIAQLGLLVLLATPVVRVAASVAGFALEGDRLYSAITLVVLLILLASIFLIR